MKGKNEQKELAQKKRDSDRQNAKYNSEERHTQECKTERIVLYASWAGIFWMAKDNNIG